MSRNSVLLFFIDGLGIGTRGAHNPLSEIENLAPLAHFQDENSEIIHEGLMIPTDASMGVEGRPQSASGQTTILTGINASARLGYHKQGFPNEALREIINEHSLFLQLKRRGIEDVVFANAYTPQFFETAPRWKSATTVAMEAAGIPSRRLSDLFGRKAVFHDFTNESLRERGFDAPLFSPTDAAEILNELSTDHRFTLYEHFLTDKIGHDQDWEKAGKHLPLLAKLVRELLRRINPETTTVILTSDHGNIEDLSVRNHTLNKVPTIVWGREHEKAAAGIRSLADITPTILKLLD